MDVCELELSLLSIASSRPFGLHGETLSQTKISSQLFAPSPLPICHALAVRANFLTVSAMPFSLLSHFEQGFLLLHGAQYVGLEQGKA